MASGRNEIRDKLRKAHIEWPRLKSTHFLPITVLYDCLKPDSVLSELQRMFPDKSQEERQCICDRITPARKLLAIHLYGPEDNEKAILDLLNEGITDQDLPFLRINRNKMCENGYTPEFTLGKNSHSKCQLGDHKKCGIEALEHWDLSKIENLCRYQWTVLAPIFEPSAEGIPHFDLDDGCLLPFIMDGEKEAIQGGYSDVWKVTIHPGHQNFFSAQQNHQPVFAVKRLYGADQELIQQEREMLSKLTSHGHRHLIKLLATWKWDGKYHMLFPCAKWNLRQFWNSPAVPHQDPETWLWAISQMKGLASALDRIHFETTFSTNSRGNQQNLSKTGAVLTVESAEKKYGRHGDLKPENILLFDGSNVPVSNLIGDLQIADFGLSRFHHFESRSKVDPRTISGSQTYIPPELYLQSPVSRAYDIWSLACVYLEFISWMLGGPNAIESFADRRMEVDALNPQVTTDTFYTELVEGSSKVATVRQGVIDWIADLRQSPACSTMIEELLDLVEDKMLKVATKERINAPDLDVKLGHILLEAQELTYRINQ